MNELRFYTFVNFYLSSIQQGVQSFHVLGEMFNKYSKHASTEPVVIEDRLRDWSENHKTLIVLNGGANTDIEDKYYKLEELSRSLSFPMPFAKFSEDEKSLGGIVTACGCVLPEEIYEAVDYRKCCNLIQEGLGNFTGKIPTGADYQLAAYYYVNDGKCAAVYKEGSPEHELITLLKSCPLAR